jgi:putative FmdB family regulatory protein
MIILFLFDYSLKPKYHKWYIPNAVTLDLVHTIEYPKYRKYKMPVYEYLCPSCNSKFEMLRPVSCAEQNADCPKCSTEAKRVLSTFIAFNKFANTEEGHSPIAGTMSSCSTCGASSCDSCH